MVLAPPGTGSYRFKPRTDLPGQPNLRAHFASAACRSGPFIEGLEPYGPLSGDFRNWRLPCQVEARRASAPTAGLSWVEGIVVGEGPYVGQRRGVIHVWGRGWLVYDRPPALKSGKPACIGWQFGPDVTCRLEEGGRVVAQDAAVARPLHMLTCGSGEATVVTGGWDPFRGWVSPSYGRLQPAANLRFVVPSDHSGAAFFLTLDAADGQRLEQVVDDDNGLGFRTTSPREEMLLLLGAGGQAPVVRWSDVSFCGRALCLWRDEEGVTVRALGLTRLTAPGWKLKLEARQPVDFELVLADGEVRWPRGRCPGLEVDVCRDGT
jgi:hypothetical protein